MVSSFSIFFIVAFYFYFKQYYEKHIAFKIKDEEEQKQWLKILKKKLMIFPAGMVAVVVLYGISFTLMYLYPEVENVKLSRRIVDAFTALICVGTFYIDKRVIDRRLNIKPPTIRPDDINEPGIDIPEREDVV
jgi:Na+/H+ antiporter NhaD/arsenite permease-like protein